MVTSSRARLAIAAVLATALLALAAVDVLQSSLSNQTSAPTPRTIRPRFTEHPASRSDDNPSPVAASVTKKQRTHQPLVGSAPQGKQPTRAAIAEPPSLEPARPILEEFLQASRLEAQHLKGLAYYFQQPDVVEPAILARKIWAEAYTRFVDMQRGWIASHQPNALLYEPAPSPKAAAVCIDEPDLAGVYLHRIEAYVSAWGVSYSGSTQHEANASALAACRAGAPRHGNPGCICRIIAESNGPRPPIPQGWVDAIGKLQARLVKITNERLLESTVSHVLSDTLRLSARANERTTTTTLDRFRLGPPSHLVLGYPDHSRDYASLCRRRYSYAYYQVPKKDLATTKAELASLDIGRLYGCYSVSLDTKEKFRNNPELLSERQCRYATRLSRQRSTTTASVTFPGYWPSTGAHTEAIAVYSENVVRVDGGGEPLYKRRLSRPIAFRTDRALFLVAELRAPDPLWNCYVSRPFVGKAFDLSQCSSRKQCRDVALRQVIPEIKRLLRGRPFSATEVNDPELFSSEFRMRRRERPSFILGGAYYEWSNYIVAFETASSEDPYGSAYGRSNFIGKRAEDPVYIFMRLEHEHTISKNKLGRYRNPIEAEEARFQAALEPVVPRAIATTCSRLGGTIQDRICILDDLKTGGDQ